MNAARLSVSTDGRRLYVRWTARDRATWQRILHSFKQTFPYHWQCTFCTTSKRWSLPLGARVLLGAWADHWFEGAEQHWFDDDVEEPEPEPAPRTGRTGGGGPPPAGARGVPQTIAQAYAELWLLPDCPAWVSEAVYKAAVKRYHPDRGGDGETMVRLNAAMERIRAAKRRSA